LATAMCSEEGFGKGIRGERTDRRIIAWDARNVTTRKEFAVFLLIGGTRKLLVQKGRLAREAGVGC